MMRWLLTTVLVASAPALAAERWELVSRDEVLSLEVAEVPGSGFENVRVISSSPASPRVVIKALWGVASDTTPSPEVIRRDVLIDEAQVRRYYDVVRAPPASDRDYVIHESWREDESGAISMRFETVDDPKKPVTRELVRFGRVQGSFTASPRAGGGSTLTYLVYTDLGGSLPPWLTRGAQREAARKFVLEIRRRAEKAAAP
jgi:hypothetical protein